MANVNIVRKLENGNVILNINGVDSILVDGQWKEAGDTDMPWEVDANNGGNGDI